jgi:hypothetical protein
MYARKVLLVAMMYVSIPEYTLEKDPFLAKYVRKISLRGVA